MGDEREALADRVRGVLRGREVREVPMFGGRSFMVGGGIVVAARAGGELLVHVDPARRDELLGVDGARPAVMGADRAMGPGWLTVPADGVAADDRLAYWVDVGVAAVGGGS